MIHDSKVWYRTNSILPDEGLPVVIRCANGHVGIALWKKTHRPEERLWFEQTLTQGEQELFENVIEWAAIPI